jgi:hypothetical protein
MSDFAKQIQLRASKHTRLTTGFSTAPSQAESPSANSLLLSLVRYPVEGVIEEGGKSGFSPKKIFHMVT